MTRRIGMIGRISTIAWAGFMVVLTTGSIMTSTAFALPDVSIALGGAYPIHAEGTLPNATTALGSASGVVISGTGVSLLTLGTELSSLGAFSGTFLNVAKGATKCNSTGDGTGVVLTPGTAHAVLGPGGTASLGFSLFLLTTLIVFCGALEIEIRGSVMGTASAASGNEADEYTTALGTLEGEKGKQKFTEYTNDAGETVKAKLEAEAGAGFVTSDINVEGAFVMTTLEGKMVTVTGR